MSASKILVPIGFSEQSMVALGQAFNLAKIKKSDVVLLSVIEQQSMMQSLFLDDKSDELKEKVKKKLEEIAIEYSAKYAVDVDTMVAQGKVYEQVNEVSEMISADLIVMGTNGSQGRSRKFIGSNAEKVVRLSKCPVITIKGVDHRDGCENIILPLGFRFLIILMTTLSQLSRCSITSSIRIISNFLFILIDSKSLVK